MTALKSAGRLEATLRAGHFALTAETTPPDSAGADAVLRKAGCLKGLADAVNVTDAAGARAHMGALPAAAILAREGIEPVLQFTMRDRNRIAMQGDLIGAVALGIPNILSLYGDDPKGGDQPDAKPVHDIDGQQFLTMTRTMRDTGAFPSGRKIEPAPRLFLGAADSPREPDAKWKPDGLLAKIDSGADFIQTQYCFDMALLRRYMTALADHNIPDRIFVLVGIGPIASAKGGRWMNENLHGVHVPDALIARLEKAQDQAAEGRKICIELLHELTDIPGVAGAHLMAPRGEQAAADVIAESGLLARRAA
ncbi:MAG: methylenetetrahydrofolate reductase [Dongiaceae bacterium]